MNDSEAIDAINAALDSWFKGKRGALETLYRIAGISGENRIDHDEAKRDQP